jgi:hypothetical protein
VGHGWAGGSIRRNPAPLHQSNAHAKFFDAAQNIGANSMIAMKNVISKNERYTP